MWSPYKTQINTQSLLKSFGEEHCPFSLPKDQCTLTDALKYKRDFCDLMRGKMMQLNQLPRMGR